MSAYGALRYGSLLSATPNGSPMVVSQFASPSLKAPLRSNSTQPGVGLGVTVGADGVDVGVQVTDGGGGAPQVESETSSMNMAARPPTPSL